MENDLRELPESHIDSLNGELCTFATFDPSIGYIHQAINSNKLDLLRSDSLKKLLSQWTGELNDLSEDNFIRREHWLKFVLPTIREFIPSRNSDIAQFRPDYQREHSVNPKLFPESDYQAFATSMMVDGIIYDHYMNQYYVIINEEHIEAYILQTLNLIESELRKHP